MLPGMFRLAAVLGVLPGILLGCRGAPASAAQVDSGAAPGDGATIDVDYGEDGMPVRRPCVAPSGTAMANGTYGRLDGILVAVVPPGPRTICNADSDHVHLQIAVGAGTYDIAVNVGSDVHSSAIDHALPGSPWSEGWHTEADVVGDYAGLGLHATDLPLTTPVSLVAAITADLTAANHVSIYATGYGPEGAHLVHWNGSGRDGLIISRPLSATAHLRAFSFTGQSF
jgi:hypothetical protein